MDIRLAQSAIRPHPPRRATDTAIAPPWRGTSVALLLGLWTGHAALIVGARYVRRRIAGAQQDEGRGQALRRRQTWIGVLVMTAVLRLSSTGPGHADRAGMGTRGTGTQGMKTEATATQGLGTAGCVCSSVLGSWCRSARPGGPTPPARRGCPISTGRCRTSAAPAPLLVRLRRRASLVSVCPTRPRRVATGLADPPRRGEGEP